MFAVATQPPKPKISKAEKERLKKEEEERKAKEEGGLYMNTEFYLSDSVHHDIIFRGETPT